MTRRALLIHGLSSNSSTWWRLAAALEADAWQVTAPDLRGHGTAARHDTYRFDDLVNDLPEGPFGLMVGHSLGGTVAAVAASKRPQLAHRIVLIDPVLQVAEHDWDAVKADQLAELEQTIDSIRESKPHWDSRDHDIKIAAIEQVDRRAVEAVFTDNLGWNITADAAAISVPTLILSGDPEVHSMLAPETARALVAANPLVQYRVVEGAGHSVHRDRPSQAIEAILDWAAGRSASSS